LDFLPTFSEISGAKIPRNLCIDGKSFSDVLLKNEKSKHDRYYYYAYTHLQGVRNSQWKLVIPRSKKPGYMKWRGRKIEEVKEVQLFDLNNDKEEQYNLAYKYPDKVKELLLMMDEGRKELGDHNRIGEGARFFDTDSKTQRIDEYNKWKNNLKK
jgi:arylsulfatase A-like enzyme